MNIVCVKWGTKYNADYVNNLYAGVKRNTTVDFNFWCFTDDPEGIINGVKIVDLQHAKELESWWNKLILFSNDIPIPRGEKIFYIDLDTLIVDNIDSLLTLESPNIIVLEDFYKSIFKTANKIGSGLMSWRHGDYTFIWSEFFKNPKSVIKSAKTYGDQWWIEQCLTAWTHWQDIAPESVVSFKVHCREGLPPTAKIICYHGRPSIPDSANKETKINNWIIGPSPWVLDYWKNND